MKFFKKAKGYWMKTKNVLKWTLAAYVLVSVAFTSLSIVGETHKLPFIEKVKATETISGAGELTYKEWREQRAKWLITTDDFEEYIEKEALGVVDLKVRSEATASMNQAAYGTTTVPVSFR